MAKEELDFNLDEFLASHSADTKYMHSRKRKKTSQSSKSHPKPDESKAKEESDKSADSESLKIQQDETEHPIPEEQSVLQAQESASADDIVEIPEEKSASDVKTDDDTSDLTRNETVQDQEMSDALPEVRSADEKNDFDKPSPAQSYEDLKTFDKDFTAVPDTEKHNEESNDKAEDTYVKKQNIPKYKERTAEINLHKAKISDTATVEVRRRKNIEKSETELSQDILPKISNEPKRAAEKSEEEEKLAEQIRREQELTERILRKAYQQEQNEGESLSEREKSPEFVQEKKKNSKKTTRIKKLRRSKNREEVERSLPVVQVGGDYEDNSQSIIDVLENALDEDVIELEYVSKNSEETSPRSASDKKKNKAQIVYFLIGLFFTVMSVIGIVVTAKSAVSFVKNISDDSKQKQEFAEYIYPVVITDPAAFDSVNNLSDEVIIKAALWDIIMYDDASKYEQDGSNNMYIPYIQVENHAKSLFGTTNIVHGTVVFSEELTFFYDSDSRTYKVPISPQLFPNTPVVRKIDKVGERYTLTVDYQEPTPNWELMNGEYTPGIKKTMEYVLTKYNDGYTIIAINNCE